MTSQQYIKLGRQTALISFLLGTAILGLYRLTHFQPLVIVGIWYIPLAGMFNFGVLIGVLSQAIIDKQNRGQLLLTCVLILLNIPVVAIYLHFMMIGYNGDD